MLAKRLAELGMSLQVDEQPEQNPTADLIQVIAECHVRGRLQRIGLIKLVVSNAQKRTPVAPLLDHPPLCRLPAATRGKNYVGRSCSRIAHDICEVGRWHEVVVEVRLMLSVGRLERVEHEPKPLKEGVDSHS